MYGKKYKCIYGYGDSGDDYSNPAVNSSEQRYSRTAVLGRNNTHNILAKIRGYRESGV